MNFEKDIIIQDDALDVEWLNQPRLAIKYGTYWAKCCREVNRAEELVKVTRAELIEEVTSDPGEYLSVGVKTTAPVVEAYYRTHPRHIEAKELLIAAKYEKDIAEIAKWEISNSRKTALENLVKLAAMSYFAGPSVPRDLSFENQQIESQKQADSKVRIKRKRKD